MKPLKLTASFILAIMLPACVSTPEVDTVSQSVKTEPALPSGSRPSQPSPPIVAKTEAARQYTAAEIDGIKRDVAAAIVLMNIDRENRRDSYPAESSQIGQLAMNEMMLNLAICGKDNYANIQYAILTEGGTVSSVAEKTKGNVIYPPQNEDHRKAVVHWMSEVISKCYYLDMKTKGTLAALRDKYFAQ